PNDFLFCMEIFISIWQVYSTFPKCFSASGLRSFIELIRISAKQRNAQLYRKSLFQRRYVETCQVCCFRVSDISPDCFHEPGSIKYLLGERLCGRIKTAKEG